MRPWSLYVLSGLMSLNRTGFLTFECNVIITKRVSLVSPQYLAFYLAIEPFCSSSGCSKFPSISLLCCDVDRESLQELCEPCYLETPDTRHISYELYIIFFFKTIQLWVFCDVIIIIIKYGWYYSVGRLSWAM